MAWYNPSDPTQQKMLLGGVVAALIAVPYHMYVLTPAQETNAGVLERVERLESANSTARLSRVGGEQDLEDRMALYERHVAKLEELIPGQEEIPALLDDINTRARLVQVEVDNLAPQPPEQTEFYTRTAYNMSVIGEYHSVARFLTEVASLSRIVTPIEVDIQLYSTASQYPDMESPVVASFRIQTYVLPDPGNAPPPAQVGAGQ